MSSPPLSDPSGVAAPSALAAFLRGVERRAAVLAELQSGDPTLGDAALTRAMAAFRLHALGAPMADWPRLFWTELLAQPALRRARHARPPDFMPRCAPPLRAALLLRIAAGLDEREAADVLGVGVSRLRAAILRALDCAEDGVDPAAWAALQGQVQQRIRDLPTDRTLRLARMREGALAGPAARFFPTREGAAPVRPWRVPAAVALLTLVALLGTYAFEDTRLAPGVAITPLGPPGAPASRLSREALMPTHPDFALLADPATERIAADTAFFSWLAAGAPATTEEAADPARPVAPEAPIDPESTDAP